jgi:hypothetical protein
MVSPPFVGCSYARRAGLSREAWPLWPMSHAAVWKWLNRKTFTDVSSIRFGGVTDAGQSGASERSHLIRDIGIGR